MSEKYTFEEKIILKHFLDSLFDQIKKPFPENRGITYESSPDWMIPVMFSLHEFKKKIARWDKKKILETLRLLKNKEIIDFQNRKTHFTIYFLDHGSLLKEFGYV